MLVSTIADICTRAARIVLDGEAYRDTESDAPVHENGHPSTDAAIRALYSASATCRRGKLIVNVVPLATEEDTASLPL